jgi:transcriptional repressor NrdR
VLTAQMWAGTLGRHNILWFPHLPGGPSLRCPWCGNPDDKVVDSRAAEGGASIRRRRECLGCGRRFTTFERVEEVTLTVVKRDGAKEPFDRAKVIGGIMKAIKNRPVSPEQVGRLVERVEEKLRRRGPVVTTQEVGVEVLSLLGRLDDVAYLRFASVYKDFQELTDFERELGILLQKREPAASRRRPRG